MHAVIHYAAMVLSLLFPAAVFAIIPLGAWVRRSHRYSQSAQLRATDTKETNR